ncbi:hypothetical protein CALCODRAFT_249326 [Calocera cornea HHB12733]|uniref:Uncharacterized protein n=1 Tax=Calocera cornea HHB12733 TaxID=1353952 RepID=A0A165JW61_9BASI|nr:hypothetical protein CALCODRAFT_249326 [Calocera cornea HHB12733]
MQLTRRLCTLVALVKILMPDDHPNFLGRGAGALHTPESSTGAPLFVFLIWKLRKGIPTLLVFLSGAMGRIHLAREPSIMDRTLQVSGLAVAKKAQPPGFLHQHASLWKSCPDSLCHPHVQASDVFSHTGCCEPPGSRWPMRLTGQVPIWSSWLGGHSEGTGDFGHSVLYDSACRHSEWRVGCAVARRESDHFIYSPRPVIFLIRPKMG